MLRPHDDHTPRHLGTIRFQPLAGTPRQARAELPLLPECEVLIDLVFEARAYPFHRHCRYVRYQPDAGQRTFANAIFSAQPPGQRVGPWPGWRGIPPMPQAFVRRGDRVAELRFQFQGDEERPGQLHGLCTLPPGSDRELTVESGHDALQPHVGELYATTRPRVAPVAIELRSELHGKHPRLLVTPETLPGIRARAPASPSWAALVDLLQSWELPAALTPESKTPPGPERLRGEDRLLISAALALIDPSPEHRVRARAAFRGFLQETAMPGYEPLRIDTQAGETLFVLALGYDWLHDLLETPEREAARRWLWSVADQCWSYLGYDRKDYAQAHYLGCALGLVAFAFLFWGEHPRSREWAEYFAGVLDQVCSMLPEDGFYPHGVNLWIYEYGFLLRWLELFSSCAGFDRWKGTDHWKNASRFRRSVTSADGLLALTFGDPQYRVSGDAWMHLLIGSRTGDESALALGAFLATISHENVDFRATPPRRRVYELLFERSGARREADDRVSVECFPDGTQVSVRSSETLFCFRGGPPLGWSRYRAGEYGAYGHSDPSHGGILLLHRDHPLICGPGPVYRRETAHHSCPTVDGHGQIGEGCVWLPDFFPPSTLPPPAEIRVDGSRVAIAASLAAAYPPSAGLRSAGRSLFVDLGRCLIGADRIACDRPRRIAWHLSSRYPITALSGPQHFRLGPADGPGAELVLFHPLAQRLGSQQCLLVPGYTNDGEPLFTLSATVEATTAEFIWCVALNDRPTSGYRLTAGPSWEMTGPDGFTLRRHNNWIYAEGFNAETA